MKNSSTKLCERKNGEEEVTQEEGDCGVSDSAWERYKLQSGRKRQGRRREDCEIGQRVAQELYFAGSVDNSSVVANLTVHERETLMGKIQLAEAQLSKEGCDAYRKMALLRGVIQDMDFTLH